MLIADQINLLLPQTQCTKCGFDGCAPYAQAMARQDAPLNRCPPGGEAGIVALALLLNQPILELDPSCGEHGPLRVAVIDEQYCIGCTLCIQACPVDAIIGASKRMHTVLPDDCTGCDLCVAPCPVDCITMVPVLPERAWTSSDATTARTRFERRARRLEQSPASLRHNTEQTHLEDIPNDAEALRHKEDGSTTDAAPNKQAMVLAALARARAKRGLP